MKSIFSKLFNVRSYSEEKKIKHPKKTKPINRVKAFLKPDLLEGRDCPATFHWSPVGASTDGTNSLNYVELTVPTSADTIIVDGSVSNNNLQLPGGSFAAITGTNGYNGTLSRSGGGNVVIGALNLPDGAINMGGGENWKVTGTSSLGTSTTDVWLKAGTFITDTGSTTSFNKVLSNANTLIYGTATLKSFYYGGTDYTHVMEVQSGGILNTDSTSASYVGSWAVAGGVDVYYNKLKVNIGGTLNAVTGVTFNITDANLEIAGTANLNRSTITQVSGIGTLDPVVTVSGSMHILNSVLDAGRSLTVSGSVFIDRPTGLGPKPATVITLSAITADYVTFAGTSTSQAGLYFTDTIAQDDLSFSGSLTFDDYSTLSTKINNNTGRVTYISANYVFINSTNTYYTASAIGTSLVTWTGTTIDTPLNHAGGFSNYYLPANITKLWINDDMTIIFTP